jgi:hypothetical protein
MTEVPLPAQGVQEGDPGHISDHNAIANFLQQAAQAGDLGTSAAYMPYNIRTYGAVGDGSHDDTAGIMAAFQAAENNGGRKVIYAPTGTYRIAGTLSLAGFSSVLRGDGCQNSSGAVGGTTFKATAQTGPVLNFTGYLWPDYGGRASFGGFNVVGDGTSDTGGVKCGLLLPSALNASFRDITVSGCGAAPIKIVGASYCDFSQILITNPPGALSNDVAWINAGSILGCRFTNLLLHSLAGSSDVGVSGAIRVADAPSGISSAGNVFSGIAFDTLHVPTGGSLFWHKGNASSIDELVFTGCVKAAGATGTAYIRLSPPVTDTGGNTVTGVIPGKGTGATDIDTGVDVVQSRNTVRGIKGFRGSNVTLESGAGFTTVELTGATGVATDPGTVDHSGQTSNTISDAYAAVRQQGAYLLQPKASAGGNGVQVSDPANSDVGAVYLGDSGPAVQNGLAADLTAMYLVADKIYHKNLAKTVNPLLSSGISGDPSVTATATGSNPTALRVVGTLDFGADDLHDIGIAGTSRPRDLLLGRDLTMGRNLAVSGAALIQGNLQVGSLLIDGEPPVSALCGIVGGISTTANGRFTWTNPLGAIPSGTILTTGSSSGTPGGTFIPHAISVTSASIVIYFTTAAGGQATSVTGASFRFALIS